MALFRKDASLNHLAETHNVAQFVSFSPRSGVPHQEFSRLHGYNANFRFSDVREAVEALLSSSESGTINIRSFTATDTQSREFLYGLRDTDQILAHLHRLTSDGSFTIINETIDVSDGGVSGVILGDIVEFRPDATPRGVEKPGFVSMSRTWAEKILQTVYGFEVDFPSVSTARVEFSIHPKRAGWKRTHTLFWEYEELGKVGQTSITPTWPNDFSRLLGDKVFGLMVAWLCGANVPYTTVISRRVAPFQFGYVTGTGELWLRTSPHEQVPGKYTTQRGWADPFHILASEDAHGTHIASVLSQHSVDAIWSGATLEGSDGELVIEGVSGYGDAFMQGAMPPEQVPDEVAKAVVKVVLELSERLGPVRLEWAYDGQEVWVLQLHRGVSVSSKDVLVPGSASSWIDFDVSSGLEKLRKVIAESKADQGILLSGNVGLTSHIADVVRRAGIPTLIKNNN